DEEIRTIEEQILLSNMRDLFDVKQQWALRTNDLQRVLMQHKPEIVHFTGLGTASGEIGVAVAGEKQHRGQYRQ
ncbi:MAG: hypothetical protein ACJ8H8_16470, partial [Geminicoccaceae bacterium]